MANFTILYIEDDPDIRELVTLALELSDGVRVVGCDCGGSTTVELARKDSFNVILLDVMLPGCDGPSTLELLRAEASTRGIPVIFITAKAAQHEVSRLIELGAVGVICKPFDPMSLLARIHSLLAGGS